MEAIAVVVSKDDAALLAEALDHGVFNDLVLEGVPHKTVEALQRVMTEIERVDRLSALN